MSVQLTIDPSGACETKNVPYDFSSALGSDTLTATAPSLSFALPYNTTGLAGVSFGTPAKAGNIWTVPVSVPGGLPGYPAYRTFCRLVTTNGQTLTVEVDVQLIGSGPTTVSPVTPTPTLAVSNSLRANLPVPGTPGRVFKQTDGNRSLTYDSGNYWVQGGLGQYDLEDFSPDNLLGTGGTHDDMPAFLDAWNAAARYGGTVLVPPPQNGYVWNGSLNLLGSGSSTRAANMRGVTSNNNHGQIITYNGGSNTSACTLLGVLDSTFENISICPASGLLNVVLWDHQFSSTFASTGTYNRYIKCNTVFNNNLNCIAFRFGQGNGGQSSAFDVTWEQCLANDNSLNSGCIATQIGGSQAYSFSFKDCSFNSSCGILCGPIASYNTSTINAADTVINVADTLLYPSSGTISVGGVTGAYTAKSTSYGPGQLLLSAPFGTTFSGAGYTVALSVPGQGVYTGNCSFRFVGGGLGGNSMGYAVMILAGGYAKISNVQCQPNVGGTARRFLQVGNGSASAPIHIDMNNVVLKGYAPPSDNNGVIWLHFNSTLDWNGGSANPLTGTAFGSGGSNWLISNSGAADYGRIKMRHVDVFGVDPFINNAANWINDLEHVQLTNSSNVPQSILGNRTAFRSAAPTVGTWNVGDVVWNTAPASGQPQGWRCTVGGTPGTWLPMANLP